MNYYELCKKWISWPCNLSTRFNDYANITQTERDNFHNFMNGKYGTWSTKKCQQYIDECNKKYIKGKLNELL